MKKTFKRIISILVISLLLFPLITTNAFAAHAVGLLNGKSLYFGVNSTVTDTTVLTVTDGDHVSSQVVDMNGGNDTLWYKFSGTADITSFIFDSASTTPNFDIYFYNEAGSLLGTESNPGDNISYARTYNGTKQIVILNKSTTETLTAVEFEVYGTETTVDTAPPAEVTGLTTTAQDGAVKIDFTTPADADFKTYKVYMDGIAISEPLDALKSTAYSLTKSGLVNGTLYTFKVTTIDTTGNESLGVSSSATPAVQADTTAPATPTGLIVTSINDGTVNLDWADNAEVDLAGYYIYQDGVRISNTLTNLSEKSITGLINGTSYSFTVSAVDTTGNESLQSTSVSATPNKVFTVNLVPNGDSIIVQVSNGLAPYTVTWGALAGETATFTGTSYSITGLTTNTSYTVTVTDSDTGTYTETLNTGEITAYTPPNMPDQTSIYQKMLNSFGTAGEIAMAIIGGAVALGVVIILGMWGWRLAKKWLSASK